MVLEVTLPTVPTLEPAATPNQRRATAAHPQVTNPLRSPVPHPSTLEPALAAPRPLPSRFDLHLKTINRVDQHPPHANTRQVQTNGHNIRHRGLSLDRRCWLFTDSSGASPPFQGFHPTQPTFPRRAVLFDERPERTVGVRTRPPPFPPPQPNRPGPGLAGPDHHLKRCTTGPSRRCQGRFPPSPLVPGVRAALSFNVSATTDTRRCPFTTARLESASWRSTPLNHM